MRSDNQDGKHNSQIILSVVVAVLNEKSNIAPLLESLGETLSGLSIPYEIILVDDGSVDGTWENILSASQKDKHIKGLSLSRNFGQQNALLAGLRYSSGDAVVTMDGDLQHPPKVIADLYAAWKQGYKVVHTRRIDSEDFSMSKRVSSFCFNRVFSLLSGLPMEKGTSDYRLVDRLVLQSLEPMRDDQLFLRGITHWMGFPSITITYKAEMRHTGRTKWSYPGLIRYSLSALLSFSTIPLKLGIWVGLVVSFLSFVEIIYIVVRYFQGATVPGWASILTVTSFMFGMLFIILGIIGAYLTRIYQTLRNRPRFLVNEESGFTSNLRRED